MQKQLKSFRLLLVSHKQQVIIASLIMLAGVLLMCFVMRTSLSLSLSVHSQRPSVDKPVTITLSQKLRHIDPSQLQITPSSQGEWSFTRGNLLADDTLTFTPTSPMKLNTTYTVAVADAPRLSLGSASATVSFTTEAAPRIIRSTFSDTAAKPMAADQAVSLTFASANRGIRTLELRNSLNLTFIPSISADDTIYSWKPETTLPQGQSISFEIYDTKNNSSLIKKDIKIADEPKLTTPTAVNNLKKDDSLTLTFAQPIDSQASPKDALKFADAGEGSWKDESNYVFKPTVIEPGKAYRYTIAAGLRSKDGGLLLQPIEGSFATRGAVSVTASSPRGQELNQAQQVISFTFDQPVDHASAESRFSISSGTIASHRWSGTTLQTTISNLGFQRSVTAQIAPGVKNTDFGLPSTSRFSTTFTTEVQTTLLSVPHYRQQHKATCAVASLRMILAYRGIATDEMSIVSQMGYAPTVMDKSANPPTWDNPSQMFVGSVDGSIRDGTGAGPDAPPVAKAARAYGRGASAVTGISASWIATQIHAGNPVVMFGAFGGGSDYISWKTKSGAAFKMHVTSHATAVVGVKGSPEAPLGFWVQDPLSGGRAYWSAAAVNANIAKDPDRQAVVVY